MQEVKTASVNPQLVKALTDLLEAAQAGDIISLLATGEYRGGGSYDVMTVGKYSDPSTILGGMMIAQRNFTDLFVPLRTEMSYEEEEQ